MNTYRVGQVVYVIMSKEARIVPLLVIKEVIEKTIEGETVEHIVRSKDEDNAIAVSTIDGEVFETSDKARKALVERATSSVNRMVDKAVENARLWYPMGFENDSQVSKRSPPKLPKKQQASEAEMQERRKKMFDAVVADDDVQEEQVTMVKLPDGTMAKVVSDIK